MLKLLFRGLISVIRSRRDLALENLVLRHQLQVALSGTTQPRVLGVSITSPIEQLELDRLLPPYTLGQEPRRMIDVLRNSQHWARRLAWPRTNSIATTTRPVVTRSCLGSPGSATLKREPEQGISGASAQALRSYERIGMPRHLAMAKELLATT